ncbi:MAG: pyridoxal phosphate-dependent aminotransferase [Candidatus Omnitrophica bacterium]|nr:pyridoxal phosphate-dependent aminotransferase [Candidatus Omnitrophota bacterium]
MPIKLAKRVQLINPSLTLKITAKAKQLRKEGKDIIGFGAGEPDFDTPDAIKQKAIEAIKSGFTKYTATSGIPELRKLICEKFKRDNGIEYSPEQIVVSCGAKHSIYNIIQALVDRGDEVVIPAPYWVSYPEMVNLAEGRSVVVNTDPAGGFKLTPALLKKHISPKTKVLILNSPSNPTGVVYSREELTALVDVCLERGIFIISDEIYEKIIFDGLKHHSPASFGRQALEQVITVNGVSKSFAMTGWRIGYLGAPLEIARAVDNIQSHSTSNADSIAQMASVAALEMDEKIVRERCAQFLKRRDYIVGRLKSIKILSHILPQGAFYIFINISKTGMDSLTFSSRLLDEANVALVPGIGFGYDDFVRVSFATSMENIEKGMDRIEKWVRQ